MLIVVFFVFVFSAIPDDAERIYEKTTEQKGLMLILNFSKNREGKFFANSFDLLFSTVAKLLFGEFLIQIKFVLRCSLKYVNSFFFLKTNILTIILPPKFNR